MLHECVVQEMQVGGYILAAVDGIHLHTTAVVEHVQQWISRLLTAKPMIRGGIHLPKFTNGLALPAPQGEQEDEGFGVGQIPSRIAQ